jgi:cytochrome c
VKPLLAGIAAILVLAGPAHAAGDAVKGKAVFKKCMACHRIGLDAKTLVGPELNGVVGRKAGSVEGYRYSKAMANSGLVFDEATLTVYLRGPKAVVPGTNMTFPGLPKDEDIANVIAYLKTFAADGSAVAPAP